MALLLKLTLKNQKEEIFVNPLAIGSIRSVKYPDQAHVKITVAGEAIFVEGTLEEVVDAVNGALRAESPPRSQEAPASLGRRRLGDVDRSTTA